MPLTLWLLVSLLGLFILSNGLAIVLGKPNAAHTQRAIPWLQRSTSLQLAIMAWLFWGLLLRTTSLGGGSLLIAIGMSVSFIADLIMAEIIRVPNRVIGGIATFALAHGLYSGAYLLVGQTLGVFQVGVVGLCLSGLWIIGLLIWRQWVYSPSMPMLMNQAALGYMVVIATMVGLALAAALGDPRLWTLAVGAGLFMISDIILGNQIFRKRPWRYVNEVVWLTYISGQALIVWSNLAALRVLSG